MGRLFSGFQSTFRPRLHRATSTNKRRHAVTNRTGDAYQAADRAFDEAAIVDIEYGHDVDEVAAERAAAAEARTDFDT